VRVAHRPQHSGASSHSSALVSLPNIPHPPRRAEEEHQQSRTRVPLMFGLEKTAITVTQRPTLPFAVRAAAEGADSKP